LNPTSYNPCFCLESLGDRDSGPIDPMDTNAGIPNID
jgi:hypothetical protein